jgi:hypothetical protein
MEDARFSCRRRRRNWFSALTTEVVDKANGEVVAVARKAAGPLIADVLERAEAGERWETPPYRLYHANRHYALDRPRAVVHLTAGDSVVVAEARDETTAERIAELLSRAEWPKAAAKNRSRIGAGWW